MHVSVIKNDQATVVVIVESDSNDLASTIVDVVRDEAADWSEEKDFTEFESDDVVLTVDGNKVNN